MEAIFNPDGALLVDKPPDWTSHDVVAKVRSVFRLRKVGHCGTLDPMATGLLILVLGAATRLSEVLMAGDKGYTGAIRLGETTDSYDAEGAVVETKTVADLTLEQLQAAAAAFTGDQWQTPPMVSAIKVGGVPLHRLARRGVEVARQPRLIHVYRFAITEYEPPFACFDLDCTKGTYARSLAHDLGQALGCGAHLSRLRRTASGHFRVANAFPLAEVIAWPRSELARQCIPLSQLRNTA